ncbi:MAG TPA: type II toxin-antitoxin system prevent-host-death family antitoxin [Xanthobacteraceae bacterium]|jgi:prevent-host-death family protein|nr:type II toxin-antitoxin system prevent-host-death family antitoxin [Xanthobacteraceae bacterium]
MDKAISAADAKRNFSKLLRDVSEGHSYVVTRHGKPMAKIMPASNRPKSERWSRAGLLERLRAEPAVDIGPWTRSDI